MTQIEVADEVRARIAAEAARRGVPVSDVVAELASRLPGETTDRPVATFVAAGESEHGITDRMDDLLADGFGRD